MIIFKSQSKLKSGYKDIPFPNSKNSNFQNEAKKWKWVLLESEQEIISISTVKPRFKKEA